MKSEVRNKKSEIKSQKLNVRCHKLKVVLCFLFLFLTLLFTFHFSLFTSYADDNPLNKIRDETISYFKPITGKIIMVEDKKVVVSLGTKDSIKIGMRFNILREEAPFRHPVTKEPLGKMESSVGGLEIKEAGPDLSTGIIIAGDAREGDKVRISEIKVNMLFCQSKDIDWYLADSHYRNLKETGRFNIVDTGLETDEPSKVIEEARRLHAEVALLLTAKPVGSGTLLIQRLFWVSDGLKFSELETKIEAAYTKELRFGEEFFTQHKEDTLLTFDLPFALRFITIGDINGDGKQEIIFSTGEDINVYALGADLQPAMGELQIKGSSLDDHLWIDSIDLNRNGRDEIIITSMRRDEVTSYIYELKDNKFVLLYKDNVFMRRIENGLIAQAYSRAEGFEGDVFNIVWEGGYKKKGTVKLPQNVNIYDFIYIDDPRTGRLVLAYGEDGFLNLYDSTDRKIWRSKSNTGGFLSTFKKPAPSAIVERGEWAIKDRLMLRNREILLAKRIPLLEMVKGIGYGSSQIKKLWWNGLSMEEGVLVNDIKGTVLDYTLAGDKIIVLASPVFGIKPGNILKGESPLKTVLYIFNLK